MQLEFRSQRRGLRVLLLVGARVRGGQPDNACVDGLAEGVYRVAGEVYAIWVAFDVEAPTLTGDVRRKGLGKLDGVLKFHVILSDGGAGCD